MKRRDFLVVSAAALAASNLPAAEAAKPIELALIGAGNQGRVLANAAVLTGQVRFRAVCDIWKYRRDPAIALLKNYGPEPKAYEDYRQLLAEEKGLDAVIVATPDFVHAEQTIACLRAGLHVYCESMMAATLADARSMVAAMRQTGRLLQIGCQRRSNPRYLHAKAKLFQEAQLLGDVTALVAQWNQPYSDDAGWPRRFALPDDLLKKYGYADMHQFRNWRWYRQHSAGPLATFAAQQLDVFHWFLGTLPRAVLAAGGVDYSKEHQWPDNGMAVLEYALPERVVRANYQVLMTSSAGGQGQFEMLAGSDGAIKLSENPKYAGIYHEAHAPDWDDWVRKRYLVKVGLPPEDKPAQGAATEAPTEAAVRETGQVVPYDMPIAVEKPVHQYHLENFFAAIRGQARLNSPADAVLASEAVALRITSAIQSAKREEIAPADLG